MLAFHGRVKPNRFLFQQPAPETDGRRYGRRCTVRLNLNDAEVNEPKMFVASRGFFRNVFEMVGGRRSFSFWAVDVDSDGTERNDVCVRYVDVRRNTWTAIDFK